MQNDLALITGGGTGLGLGIARAFLDRGARVVLCSRDEKQLRHAVGDLGDGAFFRCHDVTDFEQAPKLVADVESEIGPVTILVNNAGVHHKSPSETVRVEDFRRVLDVHVLGAHALTQAAGSRMLERGSGSILFIASMASLFGIPYVEAYSAAKSAYLGMLRSLAVEWGGRGVRVNAIAPGWIDSALMRRALADDPDRQRKILARTPLGCFGEARDIGEAAAFLCSPEARFITGVCLPVDGGVSIGF